MHRVADLAELIVNLIPTVGIEAPLAQLAHGDIESAVAELGVGRLCRRRGLPFQFIKPSGQRSYDYDIQVTFPNGKVVCLDAKCKFEEKAFSATSMKNSLDEARKRNLPKGYPCTIVVKIPHEWVQVQAAFTEMEQVIWRFLGGASRIVTVQVYAVFVDLVERTRVGNEWGWEYVNRKLAFSPEKDWRMLGYGGGAPTDYGHWTTIVDIVKRHQPPQATPATT